MNLHLLAILFRDCLSYIYLSYVCINSYDMGRRNLPDIFIYPRAAGLRARAYTYISGKSQVPML